MAEYVPITQGTHIKIERISVFRPPNQDLAILQMIAKDTQVQTFYLGEGPNQGDLGWNPFRGLDLFGSQLYFPGLSGDSLYKVMNGLRTEHG